jgi:glycosyltransferase involved in cell wall biosynthesis
MPNENQNPLVSIVIPLYNGEQYLTEAIISILNQTYKNIEVIVVNDGSKDRSKEMIEEIARTDSRVIVINQENTGIVGALNNGIATAKGPLIARMDADDISFLTRIEKQVDAFLDNPEAVLVCSGFEVIDEDSQYMYREILPTRSSEIKRTLLLYNSIAHGSVMFKKSAFDAVGGYSDKCGPTEDYELWGRLTTQGEFIALEGALYRWRRNTQGITLTNNPAMRTFTLKNIETFWKNQPPVLLSRNDILEIGNYYLSHARQYGVDMKNISYSNIAQISFKEISRGNVLFGIKQLLILSSTGRTGLRWTLKRFWAIIDARILNKEK